MADEIFTIETLAAALEVPRGRIEEALDSGALRGARVGDTWIIRGREVREWLDSLPSEEE